MSTANAPTPSAPELKNIQAIIGLERGTRDHRSLVDRIADAVSNLASTPFFVIAHVVWFVTWIGLNLHRSAVDPYPFNLLTLAVALEAIVLTGFVLMAQRRMTQQAEKRAHLDLQINLLAEQELTAILTLLCRVAERVGIDVAKGDARLQHFLGHTDIRRLATALDQELAALESEVTESSQADSEVRRPSAQADVIGPSVIGSGPEVPC